MNSALYQRQTLLNNSETSNKSSPLFESKKSLVEVPPNSLECKSSRKIF